MTMDSNTRYIIGGSELGRAPALEKCPMCGGIADYMKREAQTRDGKRYFVRCGKCGAQTGLYAYPVNAGEAWNRRATNDARVITTQEIVEFRDSLTDGSGKTACWMENIEGVLRAVCLEVSVSGDGREVYDWEYGEYWDREKVDAEGITWRLWDRRPTKADMDREPWGKVAYQVMSDAARQEAERIRQDEAMSTMTPRDYLQQARGMAARLEALNERRQRYEDMATSATAHYRSGPGGTKRVSSVEEYAVKLADLGAEMNLRAKIYAEALREIEAAIDDVSRQEHRDVLRYRYLNGWSWRRIGRAMHYAESYLWQLHGEALLAVKVPWDAVPVEERVKSALKDHRQS